MFLMTPEQRALYESLREFDIDGDSPALSFTMRLARENGWTPAFAERVVDEYKRFLLLAATSKDPVTPSDQVDQAWHLHLSYTHSYWNRLCTEVLGRALHHNPTRGGDAESAKFDGWYERTKVLYERVFGQRPPADIWPPADVRFGDDLHYVRVNTKRAAVRPRIGWGGDLLSAALAIAIAAAMFLGAIAVVGNQRWAGDFFLWSLLPVLLLLCLRIIHAAMRSPRSGKGGGDGGCGGGWFGGWFGSGCGASGCGGGGCGGGGCGGCGG